MKNWFRDICIAVMLTLSRYMPHQSQGVLEDSQEEVEPVEKMDEWNRWYHHDDVTPEEEEMLFSDDPELILEARQAIEIRQQEAQAIRNDPEKFRAMFQEGYLKDADLNRPQTPMHEREGWEDDDDMPETFEGVNQDTGDIEEIRYDELPEWRISDE